MTTMTNASAPSKEYVFDNAWQHAGERLALLQAAFDPGTIHHLSHLDVRLGWNCLEVAAGAGSIAEWLCRRVGPSGRVVATDIDTRFLETLHFPQLEVRQSDIAVAPLEGGAFDLVHARMLLEFIPERDDALRHMVAALKPGGWLLVEEMDYVNWVPGSRQLSRSGPIWERFLTAYRLTLEGRDADLELGRFLCELVEQQGLIAVQAEGRAVVARGRSAAARLVQLSLSQTGEALVATGAINEDELTALLSWFEDQNFTCVLPLLIAVWGQKPLQ
jgi:SAM-dependent methyltransferase